jgi:lipopolysaccharide transport system ATP-binding protein
MSPIAIRVEELGKQYVIGGPANHYPTLKESLTAAARRTGASLRSPISSMRRKRRETFWALRGVTMDVSEGEVVGIVGRNGAGKSTLLKLLSRITEPTEGQAAIHGRVGSLLEVGTGFHPELTGRENIFLNGAILGMPRSEIATKFDEIVAFAEVERFIDMPVKRYSSGMYLRLAFAVAAHLEPDILIIDEVLAVGDASFQKKCLGKMGEVANEGRTVLFVSHNMDAIQRLCTRAILLDQGQIVLDSDVPQVVALYLSSRTDSSVPGRSTFLAEADRTGTGEARFHAVRYNSDDDAVGGYPYPGGPVTFELDIVARTPLTAESLAVVVWSSGGVKLVNADTIATGHRLQLKEGENRVVLRIDALYLNPGSYRLGLWLADLESAYDYIESALTFDVAPSGTAQHGVTPKKDGLVPCRFQVRIADSNGVPAD